MVNIENIKQKYAIDDDISKRFNEKMHRLKNEGEKTRRTPTNKETAWQNSPTRR